MIKEYIDHLGFIINLTNDCSFEVKFLIVKSKINSSYVKVEYSELIYEMMQILKS